MPSQSECERCFETYVVSFTYILTPLFGSCCLKALLRKKRFSRDISANTTRFLRFFSLDILAFLVADGITDFGIALAKHCNLIFCSFVLEID